MVHIPSTKAPPTAVFVVGVDHPQSARGAPYNHSGSCESKPTVLIYRRTATAFTFICLYLNRHHDDIHEDLRNSLHLTLKTDENSPSLIRTTVMCEFPAYSFKSRIVHKVRANRWAFWGAVDGSFRRDQRTRI